MMLSDHVNVTSPYSAMPRWHFDGLDDEPCVQVRHRHAPPVVWCYKPQHWTQQSAVLFVMHGVKRNARRYRDVWRKYADRHNVLLLAPEFSAQHYPGTRAYTLGNLHRSAAHSERRAPLSYMNIEQIFTTIQARLRMQTDSYMIYGHSAGAQFIHRLLLFVPDARISLAMCANAGWYTMLTESNRFPYGLKDSGLEISNLAGAFEKKLILWLGDKDTDPHHKHLKRSALAKAQGKHRLERGKRFYELACETAARLGLPFNWELRIAHGIGHSNTRMAKIIMKFLNHSLSNREDSASGSGRL